MLDHAVAVSAPGKVLLAGGYLVLDRAHDALVFGLDARIHILIRDIPTTRGVILSEIVVHSPQFLDAVWEYGYRRTERNGGVHVTQLRVDADLNLNRNPFIETALAYALSYITSVHDCLITPASIQILADNDYYSNPTASYSTGATRFHNFGVPLPKAHKTGLGSSAALVTSFTAALLAYYLPKDIFDLATDKGKRRLHNLAQAAHCAAQGKVGSGFDVASAVYGSCLYRRFSPEILANHVEPSQPGFAQQLVQIVDETCEATVWDTEISKLAVKVPAGVRLVMCDVNCGSQTPGMVKKVLAWRKAQPDEANAIWAELQEANTSLAKELKSLAEHGETPDFASLRQCFQRIRTGIKDMSVRSGVPIEPRAQTQLIDACQAIPGVIGGVVPGAGGYDAITLLIADNEDTISALRKLLADYDFKGDGLSADSGGKVSMLGVREEMEGVRTEDVAAYAGWSS